MAGRSGFLSRRKRQERWFRRLQIAAAALFLGAVVGIFGLAPRHSERPLVTVYMKDDCEECRRWASHLEKHGFRTVLGDPAEQSAVWQDFQMPPGFGGPVVATVDGLYVSGFVPAREVHLLIRRRLGSSVIGVAVRGKPAGAPGVRAGIPQSYTVFAVLPGGLMRPVRTYNDPLHPVRN